MDSTRIKLAINCLERAVIDLNFNKHLSQQDFLRRLTGSRYPELQEAEKALEQLRWVMGIIEPTGAELPWAEIRARITAHPEPPAYAALTWVLERNPAWGSASPVTESAD